MSQMDAEQSLDTAEKAAADAAVDNGEEQGQEEESSSVEAPTSDTETCDGSATEDGEGPAAEAEAEVVQDPLVVAQAEAAENYDRYVRKIAELDNFRKLATRRRTETRDETLRDVLLQIAPILDNLRRALGQESSDYESLKQGVEMIAGQFQEALKNRGLEEIEAIGQPFDPNLHEAMLEVEHEEYDAGIVVQEMEKGYQLRDKVLRPSRVVVSKGKVKEEN